MLLSEIAEIAKSDIEELQATHQTICHSLLSSELVISAKSEDEKLQAGYVTQAIKKYKPLSTLLNILQLFLAVPLPLLVVFLGLQFAF